MGYHLTLKEKVMAKKSKLISYDEILKKDFTPKQRAPHIKAIQTARGADRISEYL